MSAPFAYPFLGWERAFCFRRKPFLYGGADGSRPGRLSGIQETEERGFCASERNTPYGLLRERQKGRQRRRGHSRRREDTRRESGRKKFGQDTQVPRRKISGGRIRKKTPALFEVRASIVREVRRITPPPSPLPWRPSSTIWPRQPPWRSSEQQGRRCHRASSSRPKR